MGIKNLFAFFCVLFIVMGVQQVEAKAEGRTFVLILVPGLSFTEGEWYVQNGDNSLWNEAHWLSVNVRPDGPYSYLNNAVSLSIGSRGVGVQDWNSFEREEMLEDTRADTFYYQLSGTYPQGEVVHPYFHLLRKKNKDTSYEGAVGLLGQLLQDGDVHRSVFGNSDLGANKKIRYGSLFALNESGEVDTGDLTTVIKYNRQAPYGMEMDAELLLVKMKEQLTTHSSNFIVIEWGDFSRLFETKRLMTPEHFQQTYVNSLKALEQFLQNVVREKFGDVLVLSPMMHQEAYKENNRLAPMWYWGIADGTKEQMLFSLTTQQKHVISNMDISPTILSYFHIDTPKEMLGRPLIYGEEKKAEPEEILSLVSWVVTIFSTRGIVLSSYISVLVFLLLAVSILLWIKNAKNILFTVAKIVLLATASSPLWFLLMTKLLTIVPVAVFFWLIVALAFLSGWLMVRYVRSPFFWLGFAHFIAISIDLMLGSPMMQRSYLGYDPIIGARYYGIGNEYAGIYIVSGLFVLAPCFKQKTNVRFLIPIIMLFQLNLLGAASLGTNAGATIAAGIAFFYLLVNFYPFTLKKKRQKRSLLRSTISVFVVTLLLVGMLYAFQATGKVTHIGYAFEKLFNGDLSYIMNMIKRKVATNWKIFRFSHWTQLFVTTYLLIGLFMWRRRKQLSNEEEKIILQTGIVASVALLVLNDSGVVAAATSMFLLVAISLYWLIEKKENRSKSS